MYQAIDLFAGIGGIRLGFDQAFGEMIETVFVSEFDAAACKTYSDNFDTPTIPCDNVEPMVISPYIYGDITKIKASDIPRFDICLAGFPCQAFSHAGKRKGFNDDYKGMTRGTLFQDVVRVCEFHKPKVIFCENVKGLLTHDKGRTYEVIKGAFEEIGYTVFEKVLNSKDFGVPQNRERVYVVAFRADVSPVTFEFPEQSGKKKTIRDIVEEKPVSPRYYLSESYLETLKRHKARHSAAGNGFGYEIRNWDGVAGAIMCGGMGRERNLLVDLRTCIDKAVDSVGTEKNKEHIRKMTPREWARLQGFPDSFILSVSDTALYRQFGNSVTVPVVAAIAERIKLALKSAATIDCEKNHEITGFA